MKTKKNFKHVLEKIEIKIPSEFTEEIKRDFEIDDERIRRHVKDCNLSVRKRLKRDELNYASYPDHQFDGELDELILDPDEKYLMWGADKVGFGEESSTEFIEFFGGYKEPKIENELEFEKEFLKAVDIDFYYYTEKTKKIERRSQKFRDISSDRRRMNDKIRDGKECGIIKEELQSPPYVFFSRDKKLAIIQFHGYFQCIGEYTRVIKAYHYFNKFCYNSDATFGGWF